MQAWISVWLSPSVTSGDEPCSLPAALLSALFPQNTKIQRWSKFVARCLEVPGSREPGQKFEMVPPDSPPAGMRKQANFEAVLKRLESVPHEDLPDSPVYDGKLKLYDFQKQTLAWMQDQVNPIG